MASKPEKQTLLEIKKLKTHFFTEDGVVHAVDGVDLTIRSGEILGLVGESGCGKSITSLSIMRLIAPPGKVLEGEILLDGQNLLDKKQDLNTLRAKIGMVFQKPTPFPMSIYDNIAFGVRLYESLNRHDMEARVEWALRKAALWTEVKDKLKQSGTGLSGGQQQRLCIARAIAVKPQVLLLDEPTSALDPIYTAHIEKLIDELKKDFTIVIVTHNMQQAARVSDLTAFLYEGELIEFGSTRQIFTKPLQKQTEDYITGRFG